MRRFIRLYQTTVGKKFIVSVTGIILFGFVAMHMAGNLKAFTGNTAEGVPHIDVYAHFLRTMGEPMIPSGVVLWSVRAVLLVSLVLHVFVVAQLVKRNRAARPIRYHGQQYDRATWSARLMLVSGIFLLIFVVLHVLHFTTGTINITPIVHGAVYANLFHAFENWFFVVPYIAATALLGLHLYHGAWSLFQSLGIDNPDRNRGLRVFATVFALLLFVGFSSVPAIFFIGGLPSPAGSGFETAEISKGNP